jgi:hypothetical protein
MNLIYNPWFNFLLVILSRQEKNLKDVKTCKNMHNKIFIVCVHLFSYALKNDFRDLDADLFLTTFISQIKPITNTENLFTEKDCFVF